MEGRIITTPYAEVNVVSTGQSDGPAVLLLHGNSCCIKGFKHIFEDQKLLSRFHLVALDLPGHGESSNANNPEETYTLGGYAAAVLDVLKQLSVKQVIVFGEALGGHLAIEVYVKAQSEGSNLEVLGVMISGSAPFRGLKEGFGSYKLDPDDNVASSETLTDEKVDHMVKEGYSDPLEPWMYEAARRTDGRARKIMVAGLLQGTISDPRKAIAEMMIPFAVVNGANDPVIVPELFGQLQYGNLWQKEVKILDNVGHLASWQSPEKFLPVLEQFAADCVL